MRKTVQRSIVFAIVTTLLLAILPLQPSSAQGSVQASVTASDLNVRESFGYGTVVVGKLSLNSIFTVEGREDQLGNGGIWVFGRSDSQGLVGWVLSDYLLFPTGFRMSDLPIVSSTGSSAAPATEEEPSTPAVTVPDGGLPGNTISAVNFRTGPSLSARIITTLPSNKAIAFIGRNGDNTWFKAIADGQEGWLYYSLVNVSGDGNSLPVEAGTEVQPPASSSGAPSVAPAYSSASLGSFSYGAHVAGFGRPDLMAYSGMTWAKIQVRYDIGKDPNSVSGIINDAHAKGFRILLGIVGHPNDVLGGDGYFDQYAGFVGAVAGLGADAIEVWNEQNLDREWANGHIDPAAYTRLLAKSYNAIKANNPGTIVISGALAPTGAEAGFGRAAVWNDDNYLRGMRAAGAASYMDCLGAHYNEGIVSPYQTSGDPRDNYYTRYYWGMVNTYRSIIAKPICFTELGYLTPEGFGALPGNFAWASNTTVAQQAQWVADVIRISASSGIVPLVIIWNMDFTGSFGSDPMGGYALIRPDGSCPACDRLAGR